MLNGTCERDILVLNLIVARKVDVGLEFSISFKEIHLHFIWSSSIGSISLVEDQRLMMNKLHGMTCSD